MSDSSGDDLTPVFPYSEYPTASAGEPVTFYVGSLSSFTRFDIHQLLSISSPLFNDLADNARIITRPVEQPNTDPDIFRLVCTWLYERKPPVATVPEDLLTLMKTWVTLGKLGIWDKQNTIMRLGMALMQSKEYQCPVETVRWVYQHTPPSSKLRGYIIAIFCQRGPRISAETFSPENTKLCFFRDAINFFSVLNKVRNGNPQGLDGYDLHGQFPMVHHFAHADRAGGVMATLLTHGEDVDRSRIKYPLPSFLVWGEKWEHLPDMHFFVDKVDAAVEGREVLSQLTKMW